MSTSIPVQGVEGVLNDIDTESAAAVTTTIQKMRVKKDCGKPGEVPHLSLRLGDLVRGLGL